MKHNKAIKYRIYPNKEQVVLLSKTFGCVRFVYNKMLSDRKEAYDKDGSFFYSTPAMYKKYYPFLKEVDSLALANAQLNLDKAYKGFFSKKARFPKFKSKKKNNDSYTTNNQKGSIEILDGLIKLPKVKHVKAVIHRQLPKGAVIKTATISRTKSNKYYCSIMYEVEQSITKITPTKDKTIGLDYSSSHFYIDSNGNSVDYPKFYRQTEEKLKRAQRKLSKKQKGSNNRAKASLKVAKIHEKVKNQRLDFLHKLSKDLANNYDLVCVEDINLQNISRCLKLGKSTHDNGFGLFRVILEYKLNDRGKQLIKVDKWYPSSKTCSVCGHKNTGLKLKDRVWTCDNCNTIHNRDYNAALNIKNEGLRLVGLL